MLGWALNLGFAASGVAGATLEKTPLVLYSKITPFEIQSQIKPFEVQSRAKPLTARRKDK